MKKKFATLAVAVIALFGVSANAQEAPQNKMYQPREFTEWAFEGILLDINQQARIDSLNAAVKANCPLMEAPECQAPQQCPKGGEGACAQQGQQCQKGGQGACAQQGQQCPKGGEGAACQRGGKKCPKGEGACAKDSTQCQKGGQGAACQRGGKKCPKGEGACAKDSTQCPRGGEGNGHRQMRHGGNRPVMGCPYGEDYVNKVKEILTPDQYVVFLENIVNYQPQRSQSMQQRKMQPQRGRRDGAQMRRAPERLGQARRVKATAN